MLSTASHSRMGGNGSGGGAAPGGALPVELLHQLPESPEAMLHTAHQITLYAYSHRVNHLEQENQALRASFAKSQTHSSTVERRCVELERELAETQERLRAALEERDSVSGERTALISTVKRLNRDIAKADTFKMSMMKALQDETQHIPPNSSNLLLKSAMGEEDYYAAPTSTALPASVTGGGIGVPPPRDTIRSRLNQDTHSLHRSTIPTAPPQHTIASTSSPPIHASSWSPTRPTSASAALTSSSVHLQGAGGSPLRKEPNGRVDGKEFFRQARSRMPQDSFSKFLQNIKELNSHKKSHEDALQTARDLFGPTNHDLYEAFEAMIGRHLH